MLNLPQPLTQSQANVRADYWARKRTDEECGFCVYFCEDEEAYYVVAFSDATGDSGHIFSDLELVKVVDIVKPDTDLDEAVRLAALTLDY
tara:strand:- start:1750 stop:2019 length:270 start_codon:yes stop_codon:yes gene_type:complete